jgi:hypothetical protein
LDASRFVLGDYLGRVSGEASRSGFPYSFGASGNYATLSGSVSFGFLVLLFSFFVSHLLHYSCVNVVLFLWGRSFIFWVLDLGRGELRNKGAGQGAGRAGVWCFWGCLLLGWFPVFFSHGSNDSSA